MKLSKTFLIILFLGLSWSIQTVAFQEDQQTPAYIVNATDAKKALMNANQWRWTRKDITSYITTSEVVFKSPDGSIRKIPLPANEVMIAVAPYIQNTHD